MSDVDNKPEGDDKPADTITATDAQARIDTAVAAERTRVTSIRALGTQHKLDASFIDGLVSGDTPLAAAREKILDKLAERDDAAMVGLTGPAVVTKDSREKWLDGAAAWIITRAGVAPTVVAAARKRGETITIDPGEFRGVSMVDLARESLQRASVPIRSRDPRMIVGDAFTARGAITQTTGDFTVLLENTLHKIVQAAYAVTPDTWSRFCGTGTVTDFRDHNRYLIGSFGALDTVNEGGEFKTVPIPDGAKEKIRAKTVGNLINLSRHSVNNVALSA